jgi:hypothetical protein
MSLILPPHAMRAAGRWSRIDSASRGLVCGPAVLSSTNAIKGVTSTGLLTRTGLIKKDWAHDGLREFTDWVPWRKNFKIVVRAREGGETLWVRPFATEREAIVAWVQLCGLDIERAVALRLPIHLPGTIVEGELEYVFATVTTFNATNTDNTHDWANGGNLVPSSVSHTDYLCIAGGGPGGGGDLGGGGAAGGYRTALAYALSVGPGNSVTVTVGAGGVPTNNNNYGTDGGNSVFDAITSNGGGAGGTDGTNHPGKNGGSGGGAGSNQAGSGGTGVAGQGFAGGNEVGAGPAGAAADGGGGGSSQAGANGSGSTGGKGGDGTSSSITGSAVTRAGGGGGGAWSGTGGAAGSGGASAGTGVSNAATGNATANTGSGTGGVGYNGAGTAGQAGTPAAGAIILSWVTDNLILDNSACTMFVLG